QDRQGFLWIGTFNGLSRYDGASFQNYLHDPADSTSLGHNAINWLHQDRAGAIWIGTNGGLGRFDPVTETFQHLRHDPEDPASLAHNIVRGLAEGRDGAIWAGTRGGGLNRLDPATGTFTRVPRPAAQLGLERTSANTVHAVLANPDGTLWVGGTDGLARYDPSNSRFDVVHRDPSDPTSALLPAVSCLVRDHTGALWAGTTFNGVYRFDPATQSLTHYPPDASDPHALGEAWVLSLAVGRDGTVWLGTNGAGLHRYDPQRDRFDRFVYDPSNPQSLRDNNVLALIETRDGVLWAGTYAGLARRYPLSVHVARERVRPDALGGLETNDVNGFAEASDGTLWIATDGAGLQRRDPSGQVTRVQHERKRTDARMATDVLSVAMDERDGLWVGAVGNLYYRDPASDQFSAISYPGSSLVSPVVYDMHATEGRLLAASGSIGVLDIDLATRQVDRLPLAESGSGMAVLPGEAGQVWAGGFVSGLWEAEQQPDGSRVLVRSRLAISAGFIRTLYEDRSGAVWIGTSDGLDRLTVENGQQSLTSFRREDGLPNTSIIDVLEDGRGRLWIATSAGLSWRDPGTGRFVSYDAGDGMETGGPVYRSPHSGRFYLGGKAGFSEFDPDAIEAEPPPPAPVLTGLQVQGESVRIGSEPLRIQHADRVVTFAFASLDFRAPQTHRYAVRLDGFDEDWRAVGQQRQATFTNLNPGHYTFRVRAAGR
ncbi:MAG: two-component regulator propeller domain-containing protein, partial [Bacteroidota bacterium]